jgi:hypothetical protein
MADKAELSAMYPNMVIPYYMGLLASVHPRELLDRWNTVGLPVPTSYWDRNIGQILLPVLASVDMGKL